jgi:MFS family permease
MARVRAITSGFADRLSPRRPATNARANMLFLVLARGLQGIGGGIMIGTVFATVADLFPDPRLRLRWLVFVTSTFGLANMVGPTIGGMLTQHGGWRLVFFLNVPVGVVALFFVRYFLPHLAPCPRRRAAASRLARRFRRRHHVQRAAASD